MVREYFFCQLAFAGVTCHSFTCCDVQGSFVWKHVNVNLGLNVN